MRTLYESFRLWLFCHFVCAFALGYIRLYFFLFFFLLLFTHWKEWILQFWANFNKTKNNDYDESGNRHKGHKAKKKKKRFFWVVGCILCLVVKTFSMSLSLSHSHQCFPLSVKLLLLCHIILVWMIPSVFFSLPSPSLCLFSLLFFLCVCVWVSIFGCISFGVHMHEITAIALTWLCERCMRMVWKLNSN